MKKLFILAALIGLVCLSPATSQLSASETVVPYELPGTVH